MKWTYWVLTVALALGVPGMALVGQAARDKDKEGDRGQRRQEWVQMRQRWAEKTKAQDAELDRLLNEVNSATGQSKVDAMARVLDQLVAQRKQMHQELRTMHERMRLSQGFWEWCRWSIPQSPYGWYRLWPEPQCGPCPKEPVREQAVGLPDVPLSFRVRGLRAAQGAETLGRSETLREPH